MPQAPSTSQKRRGSASSVGQTPHAANSWLENLFDYLPDVVSWAKDLEGRFITGNAALLRLLGAPRLGDVVGRRDSDFFPAHLCEAYARDDAEVAKTGRAIVDRIEPVRDAGGRLVWQNTTKIPIHNADGVVVGVAGITRSLKRVAPSAARFAVLGPAVEAMMNRYDEPLTMTSLARAVHLSISQFERRFVKHFGTTPLRYLSRVRVAAAGQLLVGTKLPLSEIALRTGFCDQSHFSHQFLRHTGLSPGRYRTRFDQTEP